MFLEIVLCRMTLKLEYLQNVYISFYLFFMLVDIENIQVLYKVFIILRNKIPMFQLPSYRIIFGVRIIYPEYYPRLYI